MYRSLRIGARGGSARRAGVKVSGEGVSAVAAAGTSAAVGRAKRTSASDRSTEMGGSEGAEDGGDSV